MCLVEVLQHMKSSRLVRSFPHHFTLLNQLNRKDRSMTFFIRRLFYMLQRIRTKKQRKDNQLTAIGRAKQLAHDNVTNGSPTCDATARMTDVRMYWSVLTSLPAANQIKKRRIKKVTSLPAQKDERKLITSSQEISAISLSIKEGKLCPL